MLIHTPLSRTPESRDDLASRSADCTRLVMAKVGTDFLKIWMASYCDNMPSVPGHWQRREVVQCGSIWGTESWQRHKSAVIPLMSYSLLGLEFYRHRYTRLIIYPMITLTELVTTNDRFCHQSAEMLP